MHSDVRDLRDFYHGSLGRVARRMIWRGVRSVWPNVRGQTVLGLGYATPYLRSLRHEADRTIAFMPAGQGARFWPREGPGLTTLVNEAELPLADMSIDRVLLIHSLESTEHLRPMLREIWRVLAGNGRLLAAVPNRRGLWARADWTPFGHGNPYSPGQLKRLLADTLFVPQHTSQVLFIPPLRSRFSLSWAPAWEKVGARWFPAFSGVTMVEARKEIFSGVSERSPRAATRLIIPFPGDAASARTPIAEPPNAQHNGK
ncbi:Methyltransferase type 11 [Azospirillaceae bacterium]